MKKCLVALPLLLVGLAGCETLAPRLEGPADEAAWDARREWLQSLDAWRLEGRVAIAAYGDGWTANVDWVQVGEYMDVNFSGPLGVGSARVAGRSDWLEVHTTEGEHFVTTDPEADLHRELGWTAPLDRMAWWVLGLPGPGDEPASIQVDAAGRLVALEQGGWQVEYVDYLLLADDRAMPRKIEIHRPDVRIRLIISDWELDARH